MKLRNAALLSCMLIGSMSTTEASVINTSLSGDSNLYYHGGDASMALSPRSYAQVTPTNPSSPYDWMDGLGRGPLLLEVQSGSLLDLTISGVINKQFSLGDKDFNLFFNANGQDVAADGSYFDWTRTVADVPIANGFLLPYMSVAGAWLTSDGIGGLKPTYINSTWDFFVGATFSEIVPDEVTYLALGIIDDSPNHNFGSLDVNGTLTAVPLPGSIWLMISALLGYIGWRRAKKPQFQPALAG